MKAFVLFAIALILSSDSFAQYNPGLNYQCFGQACPNNTVLCRRFIYSTANNTMLTTQIDCLDYTLNRVASFNSTGRNPFSPDWSFDGITLGNVIITYDTNTTTTRPSTIFRSSTSTPRPSTSTTRRS